MGLPTCFTPTDFIQTVKHDFRIDKPDTAAKSYTKNVSHSNSYYRAIQIILNYIESTIRDKINMNEYQKGHKSHQRTSYYY